MSKESCKILSQFAKNTEPMSIKRLELYNNMSGDEGAIAIAEVIACCPHLEVFRWASNRSNEEGARALCTSLQQCHAIHRLEFKDNYFGESGGEFLSQALVEMPHLSELVLADLMIEEEGLIPVFHVADERDSAADPERVAELHVERGARGADGDPAGADGAGGAGRWRELLWLSELLRCGVCFLTRSDW